MKAHRQTVARTAHNRELRSKLRTSLKSIRQAIAAGERDAAKSLLGGTVSVVDKMAAKGIIHRNAAARYKSRLKKKMA